MSIQAPSFRRLESNGLPIRIQIECAIAFDHQRDDLNNMCRSKYGSSRREGHIEPCPISQEGSAHKRSELIIEVEPERTWPVVDGLGQHNIRRVKEGHRGVSRVISFHGRNAGL